MSEKVPESGNGIQIDHACISPYEPPRPESDNFAPVAGELRSLPPPLFSLAES